MARTSLAPEGAYTNLRLVSPCCGASNTILPLSVPPAAISTEIDAVRKVGYVLMFSLNTCRALKFEVQRVDAKGLEVLFSVT